MRGMYGLLIMAASRRLAGVRGPVPHGRAPRRVEPSGALSDLTFGRSQPLRRRRGSTPAPRNWRRVRHRPREHPGPRGSRGYATRTIRTRGVGAAPLRRLAVRRSPGVRSLGAAAGSTRRGARPRGTAARPCARRLLAAMMSKAVRAAREAYPPSIDSRLSSRDSHCSSAWARSAWAWRSSSAAFS